jgi:predicted Zn-dependent protease
VRGIQYWQRRPLELVIDTRPRASEPADIEISWGGLSGSQLGLTRIGWTEGRDPTFEVESLALAIWSPESRNYPRTAEDVLLTAAHEMGHALGLPHSDSERDVMYATNTVRSLTPRDFRTLNTLYGLPFLATIKKHP